MPAKSKAQAGFYGAVVSGKARNAHGLSKEKAREMLRGSKVKLLPRKVKKSP